MDWTITKEQATAAFTTEHPPREHQIRGVMAGWQAAKNYDTVCLTGPTGCGKSYIITALTNLSLAQDKKVAIYSDRKLIILQTHKNLAGHNVAHGVRSASFKRLENLSHNVQICSMQTEMARTIRTERTELHRADVVLVDEAHKQASAGYLDVLQRHLAAGAKVFGITASPVEISHLYKKLEVFATNSEMFRIGALVPARVRTLSEMDVSRIKPVKTGEYLEGDIMKECWSPAIVGHIYNDWKTLNPEARPALCFAPGVAASVWIAKEFHKHGVRLAHVDAQDIWVDGETIKDDQEGTVRQQVMDDVESGRIVGITNCQVYQEGVDAKFLYHLILATPIGSRKNFVQTIGRVMRHSPSTPDHCLITDHAGNCGVRHGSPNQDWDWERMFYMTEADIAKARKRELEEKPEKEPIRCPECGLLRSSGNTCPEPPVGCGTRTDKRTRMIVQQDGKLIELKDGDLPAKTPEKESLELSQKRWDGIFWGARKSKKERAMNFNQAVAAYRRSYKTSPPKNLKRMPLDQEDYKRKIRDIPMKDLR